MLPGHPKGAILGPAQIGVFAMVGKALVKMYSRPKVAVIVTGADGVIVIPAGRRDLSDGAMVEFHAWKKTL